MLNIQSGGIVRRAIINASSAGANAIIAAPSDPSLSIRVLFVKLVASGGANTCTFKSGTTAIDSADSLAASGGFTTGYVEVGYLQCNAGEALNLTLSDATAVTGLVLYQLV